MPRKRKRGKRRDLARPVQLFVNLRAADPKLSERAAATGVEKELGDKSETVRRAVRRLRKDGKLPTPQTAQDHVEEKVEAVKRRLRRWKADQEAGRIELESREAEARARGLDLDGKDLDELLRGLHQRTSSLERVALDTTSALSTALQRGILDEEEVGQMVRSANEDLRRLREDEELLRQIRDLRPFAVSS